MNSGKLNENLTHIQKTWWVFPGWVMVLGCMIASYLLFQFETVFVRIFWLIAAVYCATQVAYRQGVYFGFAEGFQIAHEEGTGHKSNPSAGPVSIDA